MRELNYGECVVLGKITSSKKAWVELDELAEDGDSVTSLVLEGLVEIWPAGEQGRGVNHPPIVTLTPLGAEILGVTLIERIETLPPQCPSAAVEGRNQGRKKKKKEDPYPCSNQTQRWDRINPETHLGIHELPYVILPGHPFQVSTDILTWLPAPVVEPEFLNQPDGRPVKLFAGGGGNGYPVPIDPRLTRPAAQSRRGRPRGTRRPHIGPNLGQMAGSRGSKVSNAPVEPNGRKPYHPRGQEVTLRNLRYPPHIDDEK